MICILQKVEENLKCCANQNDETEDTLERCCEIFHEDRARIESEDPRKREINGDEAVETSMMIEDAFQTHSTTRPETRIFKVVIEGELKRLTKCSV